MKKRGPTFVIIIIIIIVLVAVAAFELLNYYFMKTYDMRLIEYLDYISGGFPL